MRFLLPLLLSPLLHAAPQAAPPGPSMENLIEELGDPSYPTRVRATKELWKHGTEALPLLEQAAGSPNPEVAIRASDLRRRISIGLLPDSPPAVVALVEKYEKATARQRRDIMESLKRLRAWSQALRLYNMEQDPATLNQLASVMRGVALSAVGELLARPEPDFKQAREFLELGHGEPEQLTALAELHRIQGTLEQALEETRDAKTEKEHLLRARLLAAANNLLEAAAEAELGGDMTAAARYHALAGNPLPLIANAHIDQEMFPPDLLEMYRSAVTALWTTGTVPPDIVQSLVSKTTSDPDEDDNWEAVNLLFALGQDEEAEALLKKLGAINAFSYLTMLERNDEAFAAIGLDPEHPDYLGWARPRLEKLLQDPGDRDMETIELVALQDFLNQHGRNDIVEQIFLRPMAKISRENPEAFLEILREMFPKFQIANLRGRYEAVLKIAAAYIDSGEDRESIILGTLFGEGFYQNDLWESVNRYATGKDTAERLRLVGVITGDLPDLKGDFNKWWKAQLETAKTAEKADKIRIFGCMAAVTMLDPHASQFLLALQLAADAGVEMAELNDYAEDYDLITWRAVAQELTGHAEEALSHYEQQLKENPFSPDSLARLAIALRLAGKEEEAVAQEKILDRVVLGHSRTAQYLGRLYASLGDPERGAEWFRRGALDSTAPDPSFSYFCLMLAADAANRGDWKTAASLNEVQLMLRTLHEAYGEGAVRLSRIRGEIQMSRALRQMETNREEAIAQIERCAPRAAMDGSMADYFFAPLRQLGLTALHDTIFELVWERHDKVLVRFPDSPNTMNSLAWNCGRASRRLEEAEKLSRRSLELAPDEPAYLDTLAELSFARHDREQAVSLSREALNHTTGDWTLQEQLQRFLHAPLPPP